MRLKILYFAWIRERVGITEEDVDVPSTLSTLSDLAHWLAARGGGYGQAFADLARIRCAVDQAMTALDDPIGTPAEIAFFPPVTGG